MEKIRLNCLYLYLFSLSIENWSPWGDKTSLFRPALLFGILYVILSFSNTRFNFRIENLKHLLKPAFFIWFWISLSSIIYSSINNVNYHFNYTFLSCIISFWLLSNDLNRYPKLKEHFLYIILINGVFISFLSFFQIGVDFGHMERQSLLGNNANIIGLSSSISLLIIVYLIIENPKQFKKIRYLLILFIPFLLQTIAKTGSKGALITLSLSFFIYFLTLNKPLKQKMPLFILGIIGFLYGAIYMLQNEVLAERWSQFVETGDTTGRAERWQFAFEVFLYRPIVGVGENGLAHLASSVFGGYDPHNVYLYVLATGGLIAGFPLFLFLYRVFKRAIKNKPIWKSSLHLVLFFIMLIFWFKAGGGLNSKMAWAYFALISYQPLTYSKKKKHVISNTRNKN